MHISRQLGPRVNPHIVIPGLTGDLAVIIPQTIFP